MRVLLDANILFPTVMREVLMGAARAGAFTPLWSEKILAEWRHTAGKISLEAGAIADAEILTLKTLWADAMVNVTDDDIARLALPDGDETADSAVGIAELALAHRQAVVAA